MCDRCRFPIDVETYHYRFVWVRCPNPDCYSPGPRRIYANPDQLPVCRVCASSLSRTSDPRIHRTAKRPVILHERTLPNGQLQSWAPFSASTPPPPGARIREVDSIRQLESLAKTSGDIHDLLRFDESRLDDALTPDPVPDDGLSESRLIHEELSMRQQLGLSTDEAAIRQSIADTDATADSV